LPARAGALVITHDRFPRRIEADSGEIAKVRADQAAFFQSPCLMRETGALPPVEGCLVGLPSQGGNYDVVLWGDSHALQLAPLLDALGKRLNFAGRVITKAGCPPLPGVRLYGDDSPYRKECPEFNESVMQQLLQRSPGFIIVACVWSNYATNSFMPASATARPLAALSLTNFASPLKNAVLALTRAGHRVVIVGQVPLPVGDSIDCIQRLQMTGRDASECAAASASRTEVDSKVNPLLQQAAGSIPGVCIVNPFERYCNAQVCPIFTADGRFIYMDAAHLSPTGAGLLSADIEAQITSLSRQRQAAIP
jgi:hypothetical protein